VAPPKWDTDSVRYLAQLDRHGGDGLDPLSGPNVERIWPTQVEWTPARIEACRKLVAEAMECGDPLLLSVGMQLALALSEIERLRMIRAQCRGK
jgi:hypothetical protein